MVHSIELVFDGVTEAAIRRIWADLAAAGIPSQAPASRPHLTLAVADRIAPDVDALLKPVAQRLPLGCAVEAVVLFGRSDAVLARLVVPTAELLALHADVLARRVGGAQLGRALRIAGRPSQIRGSFAGLRRWDGNKRVEHLIS
jgi:hypothetical protein